MMTDKIDMQKTMDATKEHIHLCLKKAAIMSKVKEFLKGWNGKDISKRLSTALQKQLGDDYSVVVRPVVSWTTLTVISPKNGVPWAEALDMMLQYDSEGKIFDYAKWVERELPRHRYLVFAAECQKALDTAKYTITRFNDALDALQDAYREVNGLLIQN